MAAYPRQLSREEIDQINKAFSIEPAKDAVEPDVVRDIEDMMSTARTLAFAIAVAMPGSQETGVPESILSSLRDIVEDAAGAILTYRTPSPENESWPSNSVH